MAITREQIAELADQYARAVEQVAKREAETAAQEYPNAHPVDLAKTMFLRGWNAAERYREETGGNPLADPPS